MGHLDQVPQYRGAVRSAFRSLRADLTMVSRDVRLLLVGQFLMNASNFTAMPLMAVYMADHLGFSAAQIGTVLTIHLATGRVLPIVTGPLADKYGFRLLIASGLAIRAVGFLGFGLATTPTIVALAAFAIGVGTACYEGAVYGVLGRQPALIVARVFVLNNFALNLGVVLGPMLGAALLVFDPTSPFFASALLFGVLTVWGARLGHLDTLYRSRSSILESWGAVARDRLFLLFLAATFAWWVLFSQLFVLFPIMATRLAGSDLGASAVFATNGATGLLFVGVSLVAYSWVSERRMLLVCYLALVVLYGVAGLHESLVWLLFVVALYTLIETLILPAIEGITADLALNGKQATFFGALALTWGIGGSLGNYTGSWLALADAPPWLTWSLLSGIAACGAMLTVMFNTASTGGRTPQPSEREES